METASAHAEQGLGSAEPKVLGTPPIASGVRNDDEQKADAAQDRADPEYRFPIRAEIGLPVISSLLVGTKCNPQSSRERGKKKSNHEESHSDGTED